MNTAFSGDHHPTLFKGVVPAGTPVSLSEIPPSVVLRESAGIFPLWKLKGPAPPPLTWCSWGWLVT